MLGLVVGCTATARTAPDGGRDANKSAVPACTRDEDCPDGFCDTTGLCGVATPRGQFGWQPCMAFKDMPTDIPLEIRVKKLTCAAYRCIDGRCRSCRTDLDCFDVTGIDDGITYCAPIGAEAPEFPDGRRCGRRPPDGGYTQ
jgi:hypothetical protein